MRKMKMFSSKMPSNKPPTVSAAGLKQPKMPGIPMAKAMPAAPHERFTPKKSGNMKTAFGKVPGSNAFDTATGSAMGGQAFGGNGTTGL